LLEIFQHSLTPATKFSDDFQNLTSHAFAKGCPKANPLYNTSEESKFDVKNLEQQIVLKTFRCSV
jgi:hypothetical protein